jgi:uncharacterized membrane-anchored protein YitT (DUF2179 family)
VVFIFGIFIILHGLVHLLYFGQSQKLFELRPGMVWPEGSWIFSRLYEEKSPKWVSGIIFTFSAVAFILAAIIFIAGGAGLILGQPWWRTTVMSAAIFSSMIIILFWDGQWKTFSEQGGIGLLINLAILAFMFTLVQPNLE